MIDIHTHILPGIDDGAKDCETSQKMLEALQRDGVNKVVFTPHFYWQQNIVPRFLVRRETAWEKLRDAGVPDGMEFHFGAEVEFNEIRVDYAALAPLAIDGGRYIMLELPFTSAWSEKLFDRLSNFIYTTDCIPVIAHVERYPAVRKNPAYIRLLSDMGCLIQVNCAAAITAEKNGFADALFRCGQVRCLGSDCHNTTTRKPNYGDAVSALRVRYGEDCVTTIRETMEKILRGEEIKPATRYEIKRTILGKYKGEPV